MSQHVLIIEDDENKRDQIVSLIAAQSKGAIISSERSYKTGLRRLLAQRFDILLLDMTLPTFDRGPQETGGRTRPFAGREILEQLKRRNIDGYAVVVSGFEILGDNENQMTLEELDKELTRRFPSIYRGFVYYNPSQSEWRSKLSAAIRSIGDGT